MEGDVGSVDNGGVLEFPLSGELLSEDGDRGGEDDEVGECCEEGEEDVGGEIMVEIVGSDVFVDGIGGCKEGLDVCDPGDVEEVDEGSGESVDAEGGAARELSSKGGLDDKERDPRIEAMVVIGEEKAMEDGSVEKDSSNHPMEAVGEVDSVTEGGQVFVNGSPDDGFLKAEVENASSDGNCGITAKIVDEKEVLAVESGDSILETDSLVSDVCDENQGSLEETCEPPHVVDELDLKDVASDNNPRDLSCESNIDCLKNDVDLVTDVVHQNHVFSNEVSEDKGQNVGIHADTEENQPSQLTGDTMLVKGNNDEMLLDGSQMTHEQPEKRSVAVLVESFPLIEMLSRLQQMALAPKKRHTFQNDIHNFFMGFRSLVALNRRGRKRKGEQTMSEEGFEFDDVKDSYWTDRIVHIGDNGAGDSKVMPFVAGKSVKSGRKPYSRKRTSSGNNPPIAAALDEIAKRRKQESSPAELILNFAERKCVPSEINLNKMFRRFGTLMESETEVDHESGRAKVIFKRGCDAEVAKSSAEKFNIFGPVLVNYQIGYSPLISVKVMPLAVPQLQ